MSFQANFKGYAQPLPSPNHLRYIYAYARIGHGAQHWAPGAGTISHAQARGGPGVPKRAGKSERWGAEPRPLRMRSMHKYTSAALRYGLVDAECPLHTTGRTAQAGLNWVALVDRVALGRVCAGRRSAHRLRP